jgi:dephospho-CoA kinase
MRETSMAGIRIALVGKSGAGKSEVSRYLAEMHGFSAIKTGAICRTISMILFGNEEKSSTQRLDDTLTAIDPSIFLRASLRDADLTGDMVVDALRFAEDLRLAKTLSFQTLRVKSDATLRLQRLTARGQAFDLVAEGLHRSETELDDIDVDFEVENDGSLPDLHAVLDAIVHGFR